MEQMSMFRLDKRRVLLTGAAGYLGSAIAESLADAGAQIILAGRTLQSLEKLKTRLNDQHGASSASTLYLDVADDVSRHEAVVRIVDDGLGLHGIVNNAYGGRTGALEEIRPGDFATACEQNLIGPFELIRLLKDLLIETGSKLPGGASVVNVASMYGMVSPDPRIYATSSANNPVHYGATKGGLIQMTRYLACHLAESGIRVNSVSPGACPHPRVQTEQPSFIDRLKHKIPMARIGTAQEIASPVIFLLSPASSYITGINLPVDGGWTAW